MSVKLKDLPWCSARVGRNYDGRAVVCCGWREIDPVECLKCRLVRGGE